MVISRGAFDSIERNFPIASRLVLENLKRRSEAQVRVRVRESEKAVSEDRYREEVHPAQMLSLWSSPTHHPPSPVHVLADAKQPRVLRPSLHVSHKHSFVLLFALREGLLLVVAGSQVTAEFPGLSAAGSDLQHLLTSCPSSLMYSWASPELVRQVYMHGGISS